MPQHSRKKKAQKPGRLLPVPVVALFDLLAAGAAICVFALFHHVLPRVSDNQGTVLERPTASASSTGADRRQFRRRFGRPLPKRLGRQMAGQVFQHGAENRFQLPQSFRLHHH